MVLTMNNTFFTDPRDGETYRTVKIGNQIWMAENMRFKCEGMIAYATEESKLQKYGLLYCWERVLGVIPKGWHLPTADEWRMMFIRAGAKYAGIVDNEDAYAGAAKILKSADDWVLDKDFPQTVHAGECPDPFGFSVLPSGGISHCKYAENGSAAIFWGYDKFNHRPYRVQFYNFSDDAYIGSPANDISCACAVRCVKD